MSVTSDDGVRFYLDGKLLVDSWFDRGETADYLTRNLEAGKQYDLRIEYYENMGGAAARFGWDYREGADAELQEAIDAARKSDVAVIVAGILEGEGRDRADLNLSESQENLIDAVAATKTPTIVVLMTGSAVTMNKWIEKVPAILQPWYAGEEGGTAIAEALFGDYSPGGKLPITFPQSVGQVPLYYNNKPTGRGDDYITVSGKPLFPFGYGLSYTSFEYSNLQITPAQITASDEVSITADIKNGGAVRGDEIVQLYTHLPVASVTRPWKELKGFKRISLEPGATKTVKFTLSRKSLEFLDRNLKPVVEPGTVELMVGASSADIRLNGGLTIVDKSASKKHK